MLRRRNKAVMTDLTTPLLAQDDIEPIENTDQAPDTPNIEEEGTTATTSPPAPPSSPSSLWWHKLVFKLTYLWEELLDLIYWHLWTPLHRLFSQKHQYKPINSPQEEQVSLLHPTIAASEQRRQHLQQRASIAYDPEQLGHQQHLIRLWQAAFPGSDFPAGTASPRWKEMGWQGENPATDFRGGGFLCLELLVYFAEERPDEFDALMKKRRGNRSEWEYPFAAAGVNITFMLIEILELKKINKNKIGGAVEKEASSKAVLGFSRLLENDEYALESLFIESFILLDKVWLQQEATYMEFPQILLEVKERVRTVLRRRWLRSVDDLKSMHY